MNEPNRPHAANESERFADDPSSHTDGRGTAGPSASSPPGGRGSLSASDVRTWSMACHLSALAGVAIPFGHVVGPLVVWMMKKDESPAVDRHGKEALNFQISMTIYMLIAAVLMIVLIGFLLLPAIALADLVLLVIASVRANEGTFYRYPLTVRFVK